MKIKLICQLIFLCICIIPIIAYRAYRKFKKNPNPENDQQSGSTLPPRLLLKLFVAIIYMQIFFSFVITTARNFNFTIESALNYNDVLVILPSYLSLAVAVAIAIIQNHIQEELRTRNQKQHDEEQKHNDALRKIDISAHKSELDSNSLKNYFYFKNDLKIMCLADDDSSWFCFILQCSDVTNVYYSFKLQMVEISILSQHISTKEIRCEKKQNCLYFKFRLNDSDKLIIRDFIVNSLTIGIGFRPVYLSCALAISMPSRCRCLICSLSS